MIISSLGFAGWLLWNLFYQLARVYFLWQPGRLQKRNFLSSWSRTSTLTSRQRSMKYQRMCVYILHMYICMRERVPRDWWGSNRGAACPSLFSRRSQEPKPSSQHLLEAIYIFRAVSIVTRHLKNCSISTGINRGSAIERQQGQEGWGGGQEETMISLPWCASGSRAEQHIQSQTPAFLPAEPPTSAPSVLRLPNLILPTKPTHAYTTILLLQPLLEKIQLCFVFVCVLLCYHYTKSAAPLEKNKTKNNLPRVWGGGGGTIKDTISRKFNMAVSSG